MKEFAGKVVLITGGTSGIGEETAVAFAEQGAKVAITGRREELGKQVVEKIKKAGGEGLYIRADIAIEADCKRMVDETVKKFGRLDIAFNNAGVEGTIGPVVEQSADNYSKVFDANVKGVLFSMKYEIPVMVNAGKGAIVNMSSIAGLIGMPGGSVYMASKHAVIGMTKCAALEVARQGVRINAVCPAAIETDMYHRFTGGDKSTQEQFVNSHPIGRVGQSREIADAVLWLSSDRASFVIGQSIALDGGYTVP